MINEPEPEPEKESFRIISLPHKCQSIRYQITTKRNYFYRRQTDRQTDGRTDVAYDNNRYFFEERKNTKNVLVSMENQLCILISAIINSQ